VDADFSYSILHAAHLLFDQVTDMTIENMVYQSNAYKELAAHILCENDRTETLLHINGG
jgi:hypothetical protein